MLSFLLAISASLSWGVSDYLGGLKTRAIPVLRVLAISQPAGLLLVTVAVICWGQRLPDGPHAVLALGAGACSVASLGLFYAAMTKGSMIVVAPVAATGTIIPVVIGLIRGETITVLATAGIILALAGAPVAAWEPGSQRPGGERHGGERHGGERHGGERRGGASVPGIALALGAGAAYGLWLTLMNLASQGSPLGATEVMRLCSCAIAIAAFACRRGSYRGEEPQRLGQRVIGWLPIMAIGVTDAIAEICFAIASATGQLSIISPLSSLYPAVTVLLAAAVLRERVHPVQALGGAAALAGAILLAF